MMTEEFKDIPGYEGLYQVSNSGVVKSCAKYKGVGYCQQVPETIMSKVVFNGYYSTCLSKKGVKSRKYNHRLVALTFIPNPNNFPEVNHIDGDKTNNHVSNLEWCTRLQNEQHAWRIGLKKMKGENHFASRVVTQFDMHLNPIRDWVNGLAIQKSLGFAATHISKCCNGKLKSAYGFIWRRIWD